MELALGTVTLLALVMTVAMGVVTWRLVHEERRRSAARLAALEAELRRRGVPPAAAPVPHTPRPSGATSTPDRVQAASLPVDVEIPPAAPADPMTAPDLFSGTATGSGGWSRRFAAIAAAALVIVTVITLAVVVSVDRSSPDGAEAQAGVSASAPVELTALDYERQGSFLAISGSIRASSAPNAASPLAVLAMVYDEDGVLVASGRVPLELATLPAGADAPFSISLPADNASRYRISFLSNDVTVPHVDHRPTPTHDEATMTETTSVRHTP